MSHFMYDGIHYKKFRKVQKLLSPIRVSLFTFSYGSQQSHMIFTMSHWSSGLTCLLPVTRDPGSNHLGGFM